MRDTLARRAKQIADEALMRSRVGGGGGGGGITELTGDVLAGPGAGPQVATVAGGYENVLYVTPSGNDVTGTGTFYNPFATISKALSVFPPVTTASPGMLLVGPGTYSESVALIPNVSVAAADPSVDTSITGSVTLAASWSTAADGSFAALSLFFVGTNVDLDWTPFANDTFVAELATCTVEGTTTQTGFGTAAGNTLGMFDCETVGLISIVGSTFFTDICALSGTTLTSNATQPAKWTSTGDVITTVALTIDGGTQSCAATLQGTAVIGILNLIGSTASYTTTADGIPGTVILSGGAPPPILTTLASGANYTPAVPGNWVSPPPTTAQQAFDRIAANTTNTHPIP